MQSNKMYINHVKSKINYKDKLYARRQIGKHLRRMKNIKCKKDWYKNQVVPKVNVPVVQVTCGKNLVCKALVDTGSSVNILGKNTLNELIKLRIVKKVYATKIQCMSASNNALELIGQCEVKIKLGSFTWKVQFVIAKNFPWEMLLGVTFIKKSQMLINLHENCVHFSFKPEAKIKLVEKVCTQVNCVEDKEVIGTPEIKKQLGGPVI